MSREGAFPVDPARVRAVVFDCDGLLLDTESVWQRKLTVAGLGQLAAACIGVDQVARAKPAPDVYLEACRRLEVAPHQAVGCEDSATGVTALQRAGIPAIMVPTHEPVAGADWVVSSLVDPRLLDWADALGG